MDPELSQLPEALRSLADISTAIPNSYLIASGIMHVFGGCQTLLREKPRLISNSLPGDLVDDDLDFRREWVVAQQGCMRVGLDTLGLRWHLLVRMFRPHRRTWLRNPCRALLRCGNQWALDLGAITRVQHKAVNLDGSKPSVTPG